MLIHANDGLKGRLIDLDTGKPIRKVIWADLDNGLLCAYQVDDSGKIKEDGKGNYLTYTAHARLQWIPSPVKKGPDVERCEVTGKPAGSAPCPCLVCRKYLSLPKGRLQRSHKKLPFWMLTDKDCEHYGCGKLAEWVVSDEVILPPEENAGGLWGRGRTVAVHYWCSKHFKAPRVLDPKLDVVRVDEEIGARPK